MTGRASGLRTPGSRRGLTLVELMLALSVTVLIGGAIAAMMAAMTQGVGTKRDARTVMIRANAAQGRLAGYIVPSNCVLMNSGEDAAIWFADSRQSDTVHGSEIRWLLFDADQGTLSVHFLDFPDNWTQTQIDLADLEHASNSDWMSVLSWYELQDLTASIELVDGLESITLTTETTTQQSRIVSYELGFTVDGNVELVRVTPVIRVHEAPAS